MRLLFFLLFILFVAAIIAAKALFTVKEGEGVLVLRLGQPFQVSGPGRIIVLPFLDHVVRVSLNGISGWETMPADQLKERITHQAMGQVSSSKGSP